MKGKARALPAPVRRDVSIVLLTALSVIGFVALYTRDSLVLRLLAALLRGTVGRAAPALPALALAVALLLLFSRRSVVSAWHWTGAAALLVAATGALGDGPGTRAGFHIGWYRSGGGLIGWFADWVLHGLFGPVGLVVALLTLAMLGLLLTVQFSLRRALGFPVTATIQAGRAIGRFVTEPVPEEPEVVQAEPTRRPAALPPLVVEVEPPVADVVPAGPENNTPTPAPAVEDDLPDLVGQRHSPRKTEESHGPYVFPPIDLLARGTTQRRQLAQDTQRSQILEEAMRSFGVEAHVTEVAQGPAVTRFEVQPGSGVKVSRISALADDIALALAAPDVRIVAPIPGKSAVGIEVPNTVVTPVYLRDVLESSVFRTAASPLTVVLGQDIAGRPVVASLERLLHVLVAGATGSGKSIALNSMLVSLVYKARPDQVKFVLVDPKMVELSAYNGIPHLWSPVITDPKRAADSLQAVVKEMENRYALFTTAGARDIGRFNALAREHGEDPLPYVVVVIDELADLMLVARAHVESAIQRLTQMARAAGIHLIVATQRPSVDVITGVIKANIPTRIALAVSSQVDSRTVIDVGGAEKLVGRGDMLFRPMGEQKLLRVQGAFIRETEVEAVMNFTRHSGEPEYHELITNADGAGAEEAGDGEGDALFVDALRIVVESGQASVSNLQRRLRIGFTRAGRLMDMLEQSGYVGPHQGSKSREVRMTMEEFHQRYGDRPSH